jgi:type VI secretion system protein ImpH
MLRLLGSNDEIALDKELSATAQLPYAGLLLMQSHSALGLSTLLSDALQVPVKIVQCRTRQVSIPPEQRLEVGISCAALGDDAVLGCEVTDRAAKILIQLGPLDRHTFSSYLPGTLGRELLDGLVKSYLKAPLVWDVELKIPPGEAPSVVLGEAPCRVGLDSWLAPHLGLDETLSVMFPGNLTE